VSDSEREHAPDPDDEPLELAPEADAERPSALPEAPPPDEAEEEPADGGVEEDGYRHPTLRPLKLGRLLAWPFRSESASDLPIVLCMLLAGFYLGWAAGLIDYVGPWLRPLVICGTAFYFLGYPLQVLPAAIHGERAPAPWLQPDRGGVDLADSNRVFLVLALYGAPAVFFGLAQWNFWWAMPLAILAWPAVPAALLNVGTTRDLWVANPASAIRTARAGGRRYLDLTIPGLVVLVWRFVTDRWVYDPVLEVAAWLVLVYTMLTLGLLVRENEELAEHLARLSGEAEEAADEVSDPSPDEEEPSPG